MVSADMQQVHSAGKGAPAPSSAACSLASTSHDRLGADPSCNRSPDALATLTLIGRLLAPRLDAAGEARLRSRLADPGLDWELVVALASEHLVLTALAPKLRARGLLHLLRAELTLYLRQIAALNRRRNAALARQLLEVTGCLNAVAIEPVLLKGAALLQLGLYRDPAERLLGDLDLLVGEDRLDEAQHALMAIGYMPAEPDSGEHHHHAAPLARPDTAGLIELHRDTTLHLHRKALPTRSLLARTRPIRVGPHRARVPCADDLLVHNIVHSQLVDRRYWSAELSLRDAYDLALIATAHAGELDWHAITARLRGPLQAGCAGFYLGLAQELLGPIPVPVQPPTLGARLADGRFRLHARGHFLRAQAATRELTYVVQAAARLTTSAGERARLWRRWRSRARIS
jgi:hypothetical protein